VKSGRVKIGVSSCNLTSWIEVSLLNVYTIQLNGFTTQKLYIGMIGGICKKLKDSY